MFPLAKKERAISLSWEKEMKKIRLAKKSDLATLMGIFAHAREYMASKGNARQWGRALWPHQDVIEEDILGGKSYVVEEEGNIIGTFYLDYGENPEPCYLKILGEGWKKGTPYAVIHRIASSEEGQGILKMAVEFALTKAKCVRIDTHEDNAVMIHLLKKLGFVCRGIIHIGHDDDGRLAFEL